MPDDAPLLQMRGIAKRFGATQALSGVDLQVRSGEVLALLGENGAGKSTLMKILSGVLRPDSGEMFLSGRPFAPRNPHAGRLSGVAVVYQELNLAPDLSVCDNIMLGQEDARWGWLRRAEQRRRVQRALEQLGHPDLRPGTLVRDLSVGAQQLVEIARALVHDARVVVFDEPTSSLTERDAERLFQVIERLQAAGLGVIYISHFLEEFRRVAQSYVVLRDGRSVAAGRLAEASDAELIRQMVGRDVQTLFTHARGEPGPPLLEVAGLSGRQRPRDATFTLRRGEVLGVAGLVGAGRTELLRCLLALDPIRSGQVRLAQVALRASPKARIRAGLGLVSEDRKREGLAQDRSLVDNLTLSRLSPYSRGGWLRLGQRRAAAQRWLDALRVKARSAEQPVRELSGGNQQKIALARLLHQEADVLLLDEPTRGIDVATKAEIYQQIDALAAAGKAVLMVSSYLPELLAVCDRIAVMSRGQLREIRAAKAWTADQILHCAIGGPSETS